MFDLFGCASEVPPGFPDDVDALFHSIADYQRTYEAFEEAWRLEIRARRRPLPNGMRVRQLPR